MRAEPGRTAPRATPSVTIVGGGVHGVQLAVRLLDAGILTVEQLCIVDPIGLLGNFRRNCRRCGMDQLRSPLVHHIGVDPFSLRDFARNRGREDELVASETGAERPTVPLFFDHAEWVCEEYDLESALLEARGIDVTDRNGGVEITTTSGQFVSEWCLLAVGHGGSYSHPEWARSLPRTAPVHHVWESTFDPDEIGEFSDVGVVGGGITAAQLATTLAQPGREVTMLSRSPFRVESLEAATDWMHFSSVLEDLHALPPASRVREQVVSGARHDGAMPPYVYNRLRRALERGQLSLKQTEVVEATEAGGTVVVTCRDGTAMCLDELVCATGFGPPYENPLFRRLRDSTLASGYRGAPVLEDETLRWRREDSTPSRIAVSGAAARQVLGPFAHSIIGARRAGDILVEELESAVKNDGSAPHRAVSTGDAD